MAIINGLEVNYARHTIEMTKGFEKNARIFGSDEYVSLKQARIDYPEFRLIVARSSNENKNKGLTYDYMNDYIEYYMPELKDDYLVMRGKKANDNGKFAPAKSMAAIQYWFRGKRAEFEAKKNANTNENNVPAVSQGA